MKICVVLTAVCAAAAPGFAASCESLAALAVPEAKITTAQVVAAGGFAPPARRPDAYRNVPEFCRVAATLTPSSDSDIKVEVWLPTVRLEPEVAGRRQRRMGGHDQLRGAGGSGPRRLRRRSTDTGHSTPGGGFVAGHPEKLIDFSWRSEHEMTLKAKALVEAFYGSAAAAVVLEWVLRPAAGRR